MERLIECFLLEPSGLVRQQLRRFSKDAEDKCPGKYGYHNTYVPFMVTASQLTEHGTVASFPTDLTPPKEDSRWPLTCVECGSYSFKPTDHWQVFQTLLYRRQGVEGDLTTSDAPAGAIWDCPWFPTKGPDGRCICVKTPGGEWMVDLPASDGTPWERTGTLPRISVTPSIRFPRYHAFLTDGVLRSLSDSEL